MIVLYILLGLSLLLSLFMHLNFLINDQLPFFWDQISHLIFTLEYRGFLDSHNYQLFFTYFNQWYTPLVYWTSSALINIIPHKILPLIVNALFLIVWFFSLIYSYPTKNTKRRSTIIVLLILVVCNIIIPQSTSQYWVGSNIRQFLLDIPMAIFLLSLSEIFIYLKNKKGVNIWDIVVVSLLMSGTMLAKNTGFVYVFPFFILFLLKIIASTMELEFKYLYITFFLLTMTLLNSWFLINLQNFMNLAKYQSQIGILEKDPQGTQGMVEILKWLLSYPDVFLWAYILPMFVLFAKPLQTKLSLKKFKNTITPLFIFFSLLIPQVLIQNKEPRYILPLAYLFYYHLIRFGLERVSEKFYIPMALILIIALPIRTHIHLDKQMTTKSAYSYINIFLEDKNQQTIGFFYKNSSLLFNNATAWYLSKIHGINYYNLNNSYIRVDPNIKYVCNFKEKESYIVVYSSTALNNEDQNQADFDQLCKVDVEKFCHQIYSTDLLETSELVRFFKCKEFSN